MYVTVSELLASVFEGAPITTVGAVLSSVNVVEGPAAAAVFPAKSLAEAAATEIPIVPSPEHDDKVTVRVEVPAPVTAAEQSAVPPLLTVKIGIGDEQRQDPHRRVVAGLTGIEKKRHGCFL